MIRTLKRDADFNTVLFSVQGRRTFSLVTLVCGFSVTRSCENEDSNHTERGRPVSPGENVGYGGDVPPVWIRGLVTWGGKGREEVM